MERKPFCHGKPAASRAVSGVLVLDCETAIRMARQGTPVILCRDMTEPEDIEGMNAAEGILTARGGALSHAAVVARELNKAAVVGCGFTLDMGSRSIVMNGVTLREGADVLLTADGHVYYFA